MANHSSPPDIFGHIQALKPGLSRSHKVIAEAVLTRPQEFVEKSVEDLAPWLGVSAPTLTRFCRAVGCEGLRDLKLKVMGGLRVGRRYIEPLEPPSSTREALEHAISRAGNAMMAALQSVDPLALERAAKALSRARIIYVFGSGGVSSWLIEELQNRMFRLGLLVTPSSDHQMQLMLTATVTADDVIMFCSLTGRNSEFLKTATIAAQYGATTIGLTVRDTPLAKAVDLPLTATLENDREVLWPNSMRYGFLVQIDVLAYLIALYRDRSGQEIMRRIRQQFLTYRDEDDHTPLCD
jgi:DNA-binding MurR/RpiR family transcriptional regulator